MIVCAVCLEPVRILDDGRAIHTNSWATVDGWHHPEPTTLDRVAIALSVITQ